jgi:transcriptional regulator with XRE-family HTH domain
MQFQTKLNQVITMKKKNDHPEINEQVRSLIALERRRKKITKTDMATKVGLSRVNYLHKESGKAEISAALLVKASEVLNVDIRKLVPDRKASSLGKIIPQQKVTESEKPNAKKIIYIDM